MFLMGMRINKPWRPDLWRPVFLAMPKMLAELSKDKDSGLLGYRLAIGAGGPFVVSTGIRSKSSTRTRAIGMRAIARRGQRLTATRARLRIRSASGTRPISSTGRSRSTSACPRLVWRRLPRQSR